MVKNNNNALKCGDNAVCSSCRINDPSMHDAVLSKNEKGYCDYYMGPEKTVLQRDSNLEWVPAT